MKRRTHVFLLVCLGLALSLLATGGFLSPTQIVVEQYTWGDAETRSDTLTFPGQRVKWIAIKGPSFLSMIEAPVEIRFIKGAEKDSVDFPSLVGGIGTSGFPTDLNWGPFETSADTLIFAGTDSCASLTVFVGVR